MLSFTSGLQWCWGPGQSPIPREAVDHIIGEECKQESIKTRSFSSFLKVESRGSNAFLSVTLTIKTEHAFLRKIDSEHGSRSHPNKVQVQFINVFAWKKMSTLKKKIKDEFGAVVFLCYYKHRLDEEIREGIFKNIQEIQNPTGISSHFQ